MSIFDLHNYKIIEKPDAFESYGVWDDIFIDY